MPYVTPGTFNASRWTILVLLPAILLSGCVKREFPQPPAAKSAAKAGQQIDRININTASADELEKLPGIGKALAGRIVEHRDQYGPFRRVEHLIVVRGFSDRRFRALQAMITVD